MEECIIEAQIYHNNDISTLGNKSLKAKMLYNGGVNTDGNGNAIINLSEQYWLFSLKCDQYSSVTIWTHYSDHDITIHSDPNKTVNMTLYGIYFG